MADPTQDVTAAVPRRYGGLPYPPRDPRDERNRLIRTCLDDLPILNHYCYGGRQGFRDRFRALVAGGGTGDAVIHLAHRLRSTDAEIHYVDPSEAAKEVACQRARARGLGSIVCHIGSPLDLPRMGLPKFDYINGCGALRHLPCPEDGLAALRAVLADDGAMGLMLYGRYAREGVYQLQELLRSLNDDEEEPGKLANARAVLDRLPGTNWFRRSEELFADHKEYGDAGIYDLLLRSQDRAYTVPELYDLLDSCGLHLIEYACPFRAHYRPETWVRDARLLDRIATMGRREREAIGELLSGSIHKHRFYASLRTDTVARFGDLENIPSLHGAAASLGPRIARALRGAAGRQVPVSLDRQTVVDLPSGPVSAAFFRHLDGRRTTGEILQAVRAEAGAAAGDGELPGDVRAACEEMSFRDLMLLRHRSVGPPTDE